MTPNLVYETLCLEVTRRCNMHCAHCLRGDAQDMDMPLETAKAILSTASSISQIAFSGGEPTLNTKLILDILDFVKQARIPVYSFYIVTNGKYLPDDFLLALLKWNAYCQTCSKYDENVSGIALSDDIFHDPIPDENRSLLRSFKFYTTDKVNDFAKNKNLLPMGRCAEDDFGEMVIPNCVFSTDICADKYDDTIYLEEVYVSVTGEILPDCNYSYNKCKEKAIGHANDIPAFLTYIQEQTD